MTEDIEGGPVAGEQKDREEDIADLYTYFRHILESEGTVIHIRGERTDDGKPHDAPNLQATLDPSLVDKLREEKKGYGSIGIGTDEYPCSCGVETSVKGTNERNAKHLQGLDAGGPRPKLPEGYPIKLNRIAQRGTYVLDVNNPDNCVFETVHFKKGRETRPLTKGEIGEIKSWQGRMTLRIDPLKPVFYPGK